MIFLVGGGFATFNFIHSRGRLCYICLHSLGGGYATSTDTAGGGLVADLFRVIRLPFIWYACGLIFGFYLYLFSLNFGIDCL